MNVIKQLLGSKKATTAIAALIGIIASALGVQVLIDLTPEQRLYAAGASVAFATWVVNTYVKAQGQADQGKEAAKVGSEAAKASGGTNA